MDTKMDVLDILLGDKSTACLLYENGGWRILGNGVIPLDEKIKTDGVFGMLGIIMEQDRDSYCTFKKQVCECMAGTPDCAGSARVCVRIMSLDGVYRYMEILCHLSRDDSGADRLLVFIRPLQEEECYRIELARKITNDKHPAYFTEGVKRLFERLKDSKFALVQFDVARFKLINELHGEKFGDEMLAFFIDSLQMICTGDQLFTRLTADVFMICTPYSVKKDITDLIERINDRLLGFRGVTYRLVFGICFITDKNANLRYYGDNAALARQSVKSNALRYYAFYEDRMKDSARINKFVEDHMEHALATRQFVMYLQPKYSISTGKIIGSEALTRWIDPDRGIVSPADFIPIFEQNGFVIKLDRYIWEEACKTIRGWMDEGLSPLPISVNMSRKHLKNTEFIGVLNSLIEEYGIPKKYLEIEITETVDEVNKDQGVRLLKENGYTLLMDDFGSGYSSLNMLKDTQFDVIKIDRGFLVNFLNSQRGQKIVEHTIHMAKSIGLDMVAEGVETEEQAEFLSECGCDSAQGFFYAKPMPVDDFNRIFKKQQGNR